MHPRAGGSSRGSPSPSPRGLATPTEASKPTTPTKIPGTRSSIPKPGSAGPRGPTGSRQPSYTNIRREKKDPHAGPGHGQAGAASGGAAAREKSFVEKGFVETMKQPTVEVKPAPESTPAKRGSIAASAASATPQGPNSNEFSMLLSKYPTDIPHSYIICITSVLHCVKY